MNQQESEDLWVKTAPKTKERRVTLCPPLPVRTRENGNNRDACSLSIASHAPPRDDIIAQDYSRSRSAVQCTTRAKRAPSSLLYHQASFRVTHAVKPNKLFLYFYPWWTASTHVVSLLNPLQAANESFFFLGGGIDYLPHFSSALDKIPQTF